MQEGTHDVGQPFGDNTPLDLVHFGAPPVGIIESLGGDETPKGVERQKKTGHHDSRKTLLVDAPVAKCHLW